MILRCGVTNTSFVQFAERSLAKTNYIKGRNFEYRVMAYLRKLGYYCIRSYASAGLYDIIAVSPRIDFNPGATLMIQAKYNGYVKPIELQRLRANDKWEGDPVIAYTNKRILKFRKLNGENIEIST